MLELFRRFPLPSDVDPTFRCFLESFQRLAIDRMDSDALPGRNDTDDAIARQRMTTPREMHGHAGDQTLDRNGVRFLLLSRSGIFERDDVFLVVTPLSTRINGLQHITPSGLPFTDSGVKLNFVFGVKFLQDALDRLAGQFVAVPAERFLDNLATETFILFEPLTADEPADTRTRLTGRDKRLPSRRRRLRL